MIETAEFRSLVGDRKFIDLSEQDISRPLEEGLSDFLLTSFDSVGRPRSDVNLIDFGCGRGGLVGQLRMSGWNSFGVEVDERFVYSGRLLNEKWQERYPILSTVNQHGRTIFPDNYFDVVTAYEVIEHVADLEVFAQEISRILKPAGVLRISCPGPWRLVEPHYLLPLVHWLPKQSRAQRAVAYLLFALGFGVKFNAPLSPAEKMRVTCEYADTHTFYRSRRQVESAFSQNGITIDFVSLGRQSLARKLPKILPRWVSTKWLLGLVRLRLVIELLTNFRSWHITGCKIPEITTGV